MEMTIYQRPAKHDEEEQSGLLLTKNPTINVRFSTIVILIGCGFLLGASCGPRLSGRSSDANNYIITSLLETNSNRRQHDLSNRRRRLKGILGNGAYLDPKTVTFKEGSSDQVHTPLSLNNNYVGADPNQFPPLYFLTKQQQIQQQQQFQQLPPISPGFDSNNNYHHIPVSPEGGTMEARDVHVSSMCRCPSDLVPFPISQSINQEQDAFETRIIQPPSKATGSYHKRFIHHPIGECQCLRGNGQERLEPTRTTDHFLSKISRRFFVETCSRDRPETESQTSWDQMPDFGVQDRPIFVGILSYESPLSLNNSLHNWLDNDFFRRIAAQDVMVQLNHRSDFDDEILREFQRMSLNDRHPMTITGAPEENLNPGLAISKFCRMAEQHPSSHPNGENLLLWLEKDWVIIDNTKKLRLEKIFESAIALSQRGVPYIGLRADLGETDGSRMWNCPAEGVPWMCFTARHHRWTNWPALIDCRWFLRYLEPFALMSMTDPIMWCGRHEYCDWEKATQDGRVAWTNSQWVVAHITRDEGQLFVHEEVDK